MTVLNDADKIRLGSSVVDAVYAGTTKVWPKVFVPSSLAGLKVWFDASQLGLGDGSYLSAGWPNLGSIGGTAPLGGAGNFPWPQVKAAQLNGRDVVHFTRSAAGLRMYPGNGHDTGIDKNWTLAIVARYTGPNPGNLVGDVGGSVLLGWYEGIYMDYAFSSSQWTPDKSKGFTNVWTLYSFDAAPGSASRMFSNGVLLSSSTTGPQNGLAGSFAISGYRSANDNGSSDMDLAEALLYDHKLSDADRVKVENYLRTKWGL